MIHTPRPTVLTPSTVRLGVHNGSVTQLYWSEHASLAAKSGAEQSSRTAAPRRTPNQRLTWKSKKSGATTASLSHAATELNDVVGKEAGAAIPAGSSYGSPFAGAMSGHEIRPALWASGTDPVLDLPPGTEGNEIVEITIDEQGNVVSTRVLQSLGSQIDAKVVAALEAWHFRPATRDGIPIASKQDVYYHFPRS
jgi:TonB family protein